MSRDYEPGGLGDKFAAAGVSFFVGCFAVSWGIRLLGEVWLQLVIGIGIAGLVVTGIVIYRWRQDRW